MGFVYDFSAYPGRRLYWRILFLVLSGAVVISYFVAFAFVVEALSVVIDLQNPQPPAGITIEHLIAVLFNFQSSLIVATFILGPWLCLLLISVASHPTNQPHHLRWFLLTSLVTLVVIGLWTQWFIFTPTMLSLSGISMPQFPQNPVNFPPTISMLWGIAFSTVILTVFVSLVSVALWYRWLVYQ